MSKISRQNIGGTDFTMVGCTLTGVCASAASDFIKAVTLSDGDEASDGMIIACTFANGNTAGIAPGTTTIYSSDQVNYYSDAGLTQPFTLAPSGCYTIEYTGTGNAYTYSSYPVVQVGAITGPLCASNGKPTGSSLWEAGDTVTLLYTGGKFLALGTAARNVVGNTVNLTTSSTLTSYGDYLNIAVPPGVFVTGQLYAIYRSSEPLQTAIFAGSVVNFLKLSSNDSGYCTFSFYNSSADTIYLIPAVRYQDNGAAIEPEDIQMSFVMI